MMLIYNKNRFDNFNKFLRKYEYDIGAKFKSQYIDFMNQYGQDVEIEN